MELHRVESNFQKIATASLKMAMTPNFIKSEIPGGAIPGGTNFSKSEYPLHGDRLRRHNEIWRNLLLT